MTRPLRVLSRVALIAVGILLLAAIVGLFTIRTAWFRSYVREKIIATVEDDTGGKLDLRTFDFDWTSLEVRMTGFVLHGTEPPGEPPLLSAPRITARLSLFSAWSNIVSLRYLAIDQPSANVMVLADGDTNIPTPKVARKPSSRSALETVVDLAIGDFEIRNGTVQFLDGKVAFSAHGQNLRAQLNFDPKSTRYQGQVSIAPMQLASGSRPPLNLNVVIPLEIEKDKLEIGNGRIETPQSYIDFNGALSHLADPILTSQVKIHIALAELARSVDIGLHPRSSQGPQALDAVAAVRWTQQRLDVQQTHLSLGRTHFETSATTPAGVTDLHGDVSLDELGELFQVASQLHGDVSINGAVNAGGGDALVINGNLASREVSLNRGQWRARDLSLDTIVKVRPGVIEATSLNIHAFGGEVDANASLHNLQTVALRGHLHGFDIQNLASSFGHPELRYSGIVAGDLSALDNLKLPDQDGLTADLNLGIAGGKSGVPISGVIHTAYSGAHNSLALDHSHLNLRGTQISISGEIGKRAKAHIVSRDLNDFNPILSMASPNSGKMPVGLRGGTADIVVDENGPLDRARLSGRLAMTRFVVEDRPFDALNVDFAATPSSATLQNGSLTRKALRASFNGSVGLHNWTAVSTAPLQANATMQNADLADLLALAGEPDTNSSGVVNVDAHVNGTLSNPLGSARINAANGVVEDQPYDQIQASVLFTDQLVTLSSANMISPAGRIDLHGSFRHRRDSFTTGRLELHAASTPIQLDRVEPLRKQHPGMSGVLTASADAIADIVTMGGRTTISPSFINADLHATGVQESRQAYGDFTAAARTSGSTVTTHIDSNFAGSTIQVSGRTELTKDYPTTADASIQGLQVGKALSLAAPQSFHATGLLNAKAHAAGTLDDPQGNLTFTLTKATIQEQPVDNVSASLDYTKQLVNLSSLRATGPAGAIGLTARMSHNGFDFTNGHVDAHLSQMDLNLARVQYLQAEEPGLAGAFHLTADGSAELHNQNGQQSVQLSALNANGGASGLRLNDKALGDVNIHSQTDRGLVSFNVDSDIGKSAIHGTGHVRLERDYPVDARLTFGQVTYSGLRGLLGASDQIRPDFDAVVDGEATVSGPAAEPKSLQGDLRISRLELLTTRHRNVPNTAPVALLQNQGPITARLEKSTITVQNAHLAGRSSDITAKGTVALDPQGTSNLTINANANLAVLQDMYRDVYAGGSVAANAVVRGSFAHPRLNGTITLKDAELNMADFPQGISHANGVISLSGTNATFQNVAAESGGGKLSVNGFASLNGTSLNYNLQVSAHQVRVRYSGASVVANATASLTSAGDNALLSGRVTIVKVGYNPDSDVGSLLTSAGTPPEAATPESGTLASTRLSIRIQTAPDVRFETPMAQGLDGSANLTLRGTLASPGLVGRISITAGTLIFFGNQYAVNRGSISFYNPLRIEPILDVDLETTARSVDVILGVSGPMDNLQLTYRSDPPLKFEDIVALLATGRTPPDATIAAHQPAESQQSVMQMGESAVVGQAIANPVASRLQRVFGVSQLKIDPTFSTGSTAPQTRVTLQQQISPSITFTYTTDVTQTNSQIIRVEWALSPRFSAVASRDENGVFGVDFFYKRKFR